MTFALIHYTSINVYKNVVLVDCAISEEAAFPLYPPETDTFPENLTGDSGWIFCFDEGPRAMTRLIAKANPRAQKSQTTHIAPISPASNKNILGRQLALTYCQYEDDVLPIALNRLSSVPVYLYDASGCRGVP